MKPRTASALASALLCLLICTSVHAKKGTDYKKLDAKLCPAGQTDFDDGDSFSCGGERIRVLGVDTPEIRHPKHGIAKDQPGGPAAAEFTKAALKKARRVLIVRDGKDPYGRTLAHVLVDGELLGAKLIKAGHAYENVTHFGDNGLPEYSLQILEASRTSPKPSFEEPYKWRKKNQRR